MTQSPESFDHLLDKALRSYSSAKPRLGLEDRILARASGHASRHLSARNFLWVTAAAVSLAAIIAFIATSTYPNRKQQEIVQGAASSQPIPRPAQTRTHAVTPHAEPVILHRAHRATQPEQGQPQLTSEDRLLIQFVALHTEDALAISKPASAALSPIADNPIMVQPIQTKPISSTPVVIQAITMDQADHPSF
ncbi:hypothetical protein ACFPT7_10630 [Acidicapsa dinghuensis]|uniref:DUF3619 family protein n=1 Tax=Acidicapsa dinghuensis TaxID=2218256 RepID=A0ABW1EER0_9BACT|nr:hypothetical protein [Acidicapsa dinghuensis]